ncbi:MAG: 50S ribosomal protein L13 [Chloroflexi bacterium]|nr:50S ribosomal protein L13 [Chloroflexota bacterium]
MTTKTYRLRASDIERKWHVLDASGRPLGRIASEAAHLLLGKHKPTYEPHLAMGDHVIVVNAAEVILTGNKASQKTYYRHSGYPGNLRARSFAQQMERDARKVIETAVRGMLPHNVRGRELFRHLKVYNGPEHPHEAQVNAGTGARARKRAAAEARAGAVAEAAPEIEEPTVEAVEEPVAEAPAVEAIEETATETATEAAPERLTGSLSRYRRGELDIEAERLGITIEDGWRKGDVVEAIAAYYDANPLDEDE